MQNLLYLLPLLLLTACAPEDDLANQRIMSGPDRAGAAEDGTMALTPATIKPEVVFTYEDIIWGFQFLPDGKLLGTDKSGKLLVIDPEADSHSEITEGVPAVKDVGQGGLLDVLLDQDFAGNRLVYLTWSAIDGEDKAGTAVGRGRLNDGMTALEDFEILYEIDPKTDRSHHYGSRMVWGPNDGHLYFSVGDRGNRDENPQDTTRDGGKIYRIAKDGSIPSDNPFVDYVGAKKAVWSYGHRNPQSLTVHPETGEIWETEHGPRGGDEINVIEKGKNYGWPEITYGINYNGTQITQEVAKAGMEQPLHYWVPSIAPSGMAFITGGNYPGWEGDLLVGSLKFMRVQHVELADKEVVGENKVLNNFGRVRDLRMAPDGWVYASVEGEGLVRLAVN